MSSSKVLIAFFSRAGENYSVGVVEKGNTHRLEEIVEEKTKPAKVFEIKPADPYPAEYKICCDMSITEHEADCRPKLAENLESIEEFDTILLGYPIWCDDAPMPVFTFLESYNFTGKKIAPFTTNEGSGLKGEDHIKKVCPTATVLPGLAVKGFDAQAKKPEVIEAVNEWISKIGLN